MIFHVAKIVEEWATKATSDLFFKDFMYDDLDLFTPFGQAVDNFLMDHRYVRIRGLDIKIVDSAPLVRFALC